VIGINIIDKNQGQKFHVGKKRLWVGKCRRLVGKCRRFKTMFFSKKKTQLPKMDRSAGLTGKTSLEKINIVSAKKQLLLKKQKNTIRKMQV